MLLSAVSEKSEFLRVLLCDKCVLLSSGKHLQSGVPALHLPAGPLYQALSSFQGGIISAMLKCEMVLIDILLMNELS